MSVAQALEDIYVSLGEDNKNIDQHIDRLRAAMQAEGLKSVALNPEKIYQNNRAGRKLLQSYFKRRGVNVSFEG